ncbi:MAG: aspartyl/asparaginyl beta-hydroxylase domain-containing protein, partial [Proteobacteria bacterium]|nr:aspartyl/asparaginyl beta-hydroxylase domain-containing protein [Pseudomonadota bacterium]
VEFVVGGEAVPLAEGECWYLNFDLPHRIVNRGVSDRVHLVIDARVNAWVGKLFARLRAEQGSA